MLTMIIKTTSMLYNVVIYIHVPSIDWWWHLNQPKKTITQLCYWGWRDFVTCREPRTLVVITWWQRDHMCVYSDLQQCNGCLSSELLTVYLWCYIPEWPQQDVLTKTLSLVKSEQFKQANLQQTHVHDTSYRRTQYKY